MLTSASFRITVILVLALTTQWLSAQQRVGPEGIRERDPVLSATGRTLYFTRPDHVRNQGTEDRSDVWFRKRTEDGQWGPALNPGSPVNSFGEDRLLSCSVDGNRLAVLRSGDHRRIDLLEREGRNWRIMERWTLPREVDQPEEMTFNATGQELVYSRQSAEGASRDLFLRRALPHGAWGGEEPLTSTHGPDNETKPQFAADGRTLYFRRGAGLWYRQTDRGEVPQAVDIPSRYLQVAATDQVMIAASDDLGRDEHLIRADLPPGVRCPPGHISYGILGAAPPDGSSTVGVPLSSGVELPVRPDVLRRYAVVLRGDEVPFPASKIPALDRSRPAGSLASLGEIATQNRGAYLKRAVDEGEREIRELDRMRRQRYSDRHSLISGMTTAEDTITPPDNTKINQDRYARELIELERMKEKFRRQQEERFRDRQRGSYLDLDWNDDELPAPDTANRVDTQDLESRVRSGLYPNQRQPATARRPWENDIRSTPPRQLDADYDRQLRELEALRAQLREINGTTTDGRDLESKGQPEYRSGGTALPAAGLSVVGVTFIPQTAYPNSAGYEALDLLSERVKSATSLVEIRVHTAPDLNTREAQILSEERAVTIRNFLRDAGNNAANFRVVGYGNHQPEGGERVEIAE